MRIVYVVSYYKPAYVYGGPVKSISSMCEALVRLGAQVTVLTTNANGSQRLPVPLGQAVEVNGVQVLYYPVESRLLSGFFYSPALAQAVKRQIASFDIAVLETFFTHAMGPAAQACWEHRVPYILPLRGQLLPWALRHKRYKKALYLSLVGRQYLNRAAAFHCTDPIEVEAVSRLRLKPPSFVVPNGIDISAWEVLPSRGKLRERLNIPPGDFVLLFLGRLHRVKSPELALEAFTRLKRRDVHLVFVGPDEEGYRTRFQAKADDTPWEDRLHFTGLLTGERLLEAFADADLFLMPSAMESFGMAAVEALAAGLPVLVSENVPVGRWIQQALAGAQVAWDAQALAEKIETWLSNPSELRAMGQRGRELARQKFDLSVVAQQMLAQCCAIVANGFPANEIT